MKKELGQSELPVSRKDPKTTRKCYSGRLSNFVTLVRCLQPPTPSSATWQSPECKWQGLSLGGEASWERRRLRLRWQQLSFVGPSPSVLSRGRPFPCWGGWRGWGQEQQWRQAGGAGLLSRSITGADSGRRTHFVWGRAEICSGGANFTWASVVAYCLFLI